MTTTAIDPTFDVRGTSKDRTKLLEMELVEIRYRVLAVSALLCEPVSDKNLREAKKLLEPVYQDALAAHQEEKLREPTERTKAIAADAARWRLVEQSLVDWRDAANYPADISYAQGQARRNMVAAVEKALAHLKRDQEAGR